MNCTAEKREYGGRSNFFVSIVQVLLVPAGYHLHTVLPFRSVNDLDRPPLRFCSLIGSNIVAKLVNEYIRSLMDNDQCVQSRVYLIHSFVIVVWQRDKKKGSWMRYCLRLQKEKTPADPRARCTHSFGSFWLKVTLNQSRIPCLADGKKDRTNRIPWHTKDEAISSSSTANTKIWERMHAFAVQLL